MYGNQPRLQFYEPGNITVKASPQHARFLLVRDAAIVATALEAGCSELWSEDLNHGQRKGSLIIVNPFRDV